ncbi:GNAT family N-acetyltransferase [Halotalea alkalilenta]|uniref:GNAT family N-acetyltransferase n=1 Tax=Halotalea alkalilenta TaxID=376489 RepID=UPI0004827562|nr:N-acetyltransferase [Halotalea alkalilenta]
MSVEIRPAVEADFDAIWSFFQPIAAAGETYALDPAIDRSDAQRYWMETPKRTLVAVERDADGRETVLGSYYIKANAQGPGDHVCNCGYMVAFEARGRGIAGRMCEHSLALGRELGFRAMQFNCVVSTNQGAVRLWQRHGFEIVGRLPGAFRHPREGLVDAYVMYRML